MQFLNTIITAFITTIINYEITINISVIVGESGSGKSALTCNWTLQYKNADQHKLVIAYYIGCTAASTDLANLLRRYVSKVYFIYLNGCKN